MDRSQLTRLLRGAIGGIALVATAVLTGGQARQAVDLTLVLAIDCSYSVNDAEFRQQMEGLARAFRHPDVVAAIMAGPKGRIAVVVMQWSGANVQAVAVPWMLVDGERSASDFAGRIESSGRHIEDGSTSISAAIDAGLVLQLRSPYAGARAVIDISGDGDNNNGGPPDASRDRAVAAGITVNGLVILNDLFYLDRYFENHVAGGAGHFVTVAGSYDDYSDAILLKLLKEISQPTV